MAQSWFTEGEEKKPEEPGLRMLSPSQINTFLSCRRKWFYRYIMELPDEDSFATARGRAVHSTLEHFFDYRVPGKVTLDTLEVNLMKRGRMLLKEAWKKGVII